VNAPERKRLGEILIERGKLDAGGLDRALRLQQDSGERLGVLLVTLGTPDAPTTAAVRRYLAELLHDRRVDLILLDQSTGPLEDDAFIRSARRLSSPRLPIELWTA